ncbi:MAG: hypothetical protein JWO78_1472 [Micavibrio sp.]|nr:hypothetical protein [Micavibrio sp.]
MKTNPLKRLIIRPRAIRENKICPPDKVRTLYTIGYEGVTAEALCRSLKDAGVKLLIDVRAVPLSRKPGLSKNKLATKLAENGIQYLGLKGLGTPAEGREAARKGRTAEMRRIFYTYLETEDAQRDMHVAIKAARQQISCLLCFEHAPQSCHRLMVAEKMSEQENFGIVHLNPAI